MEENTHKHCSHHWATNMTLDVLTEVHTGFLKHDSLQTPSKVYIHAKPAQEGRLQQQRWVETRLCKIIWKSLCDGHQRVPHKRRVLIWRAFHSKFKPGQSSLLYDKCLEEKLLVSLKYFDKQGSLFPSKTQFHPRQRLYAYTLSSPFKFIFPGPCWILLQLKCEAV